MSSCLDTGLPSPTPLIRLTAVKDYYLTRWHTLSLVNRLRSVFKGRSRRFSWTVLIYLDTLLMYLLNSTLGRL